MAPRAGRRPGHTVGLGPDAGDAPVTTRALATETSAPLEVAANIGVAAARPVGPPPSVAGGGLRAARPARLPDASPFDDPAGRPHGGHVGRAPDPPGTTRRTGRPPVGGFLATDRPRRLGPRVGRRGGPRDARHHTLGRGLALGVHLRPALTGRPVLAARLPPTAFRQTPPGGLVNTAPDPRPSGPTGLGPLQGRRRRRPFRPSDPDDGGDMVPTRPTVPVACGVLARPPRRKTLPLAGPVPVAGLLRPKAGLLRRPRTRGPRMPRLVVVGP